MIVLPPCPKDTPIQLMLEEAQNGGWLVRVRSYSREEGVVLGAYTNPIEMLADLTNTLSERPPANEGAQ